MCQDIQAALDAGRLLAPCHCVQVRPTPHSFFLLALFLLALLLLVVQPPLGRDRRATHEVNDFSGVPAHSVYASTSLCW
ncbi:hypothetical protein GALMADRAFT_258234 [Galerina marginata CBS 339.88]|uniref:Uncharacterized protein n=1 Tax=Galerina marginata (strain CBS 339.88) TaxID=685588 RepID=A0A067SC57_GALM3|nr:hypothetical protein GALMADRAFT_258234 [Galerina marginata CBS 339.88]